MPLHFSDLSFRSLLGTMPLIVFITSDEGETLYLNQKWYDYTGYVVGDISNDSWVKSIHPDDLPAVISSWKEVAAKKQHWGQEYRIRRHDGVYHWHLGRSVPEFDKDGNVKRWIGTVTDIETQKMASKALVEVNELLEEKVNQRTKELSQTNSFLDTMIENIPNMIFVKDVENLSFVRFNKAGEDLLGVSRDQLIGKNDFDFFPLDQAESFQSKDRAVIAGKILVDIPEEPISTKAGLRTLHTKKLPVYDSQGIPRYLLGISEDITEKKKLEAERLHYLESQIEKKESQKTTDRFKFLSDASALLGSTLDYEKILADLTNLSVPAIADWCSIELAQPDRSLKQIAVAHRNPEKTKWTWELRNKFPHRPDSTAGALAVTKSGKSQLYPEISRDLVVASAINDEHLNLMKSVGFRSFICVPIRSRGRVYGALSLMTTDESMRNYIQSDLQLAEDIAERAGSAVENAQLYKEASQLNRIKDEFLATLSHELRTPLNVILGHSEILSSETNLSAEQMRLSIESIHRNAQAQTRLIDDLLDVSSIITGKVSYTPTEVNPTAIIDNIIGSLHSTAQAKGVQLKLNTSSAPAVVFADATRLQQIVWNLLSNAIKFTPDKGSVSIILKTEKQDWEIIITDTGSGIDPEFLPYVFDRFRQEDASTTRRYGGLGLGLSIVRHLAEIHGGYVVAESPGKNKGSTFKVFMPLKGLSSQTHISDNKNVFTKGPLAIKKNISLQNKKVLIVEDSEDSRVLVHLILNKYGAQIVEAESAAEAREKLKTFEPDLIISDIGMAEENGIEFMQKFRRSESKKTQQTPAIALTAYVREEEKEAILNAGFQAHVGKPVSADLLISEIQKILCL